MSLSDGIPVIAVSGIAVNPNYPDSIFILTGDGDGKFTYSTGVLLTTNGGQTWQSTGLQWNANDKAYGYKLLMHPTNRNIMFAATNKGIYKTTNAGVTWFLKKDDHFTDIAFKPGVPSTMYAAGFDTYFYRSTNGGETWTASMQSVGPIPGRKAIGVSPDHPEAVFLIAASNQTYIGVLQSADNGQNFVLVSKTPNILGSKIAFPYLATSQAEYDMAIAVSPTNVLEVHVGGINCWRSDNAGTDWDYTSYFDESVVPPGRYTHADIHSLVFNNNRLYCGSDGGVFYSDDHAESWHDISKGLEITQFFSIAAPPNNLNTLWGGSQDNGLNKWTSPATTMDHQVGGDIVQCLVDYSDGNIAYAMSSLGQAITVTKNGGANWGFFPPPQSLGLRGDFRAPLVMHPTDPTKLYAGYNKVVMITDNAQGGKDFTPRSLDFTNPLVALGMSKANSSYMYAATPTVLRRCANIMAPAPTWTNITGTLPVAFALMNSIQVSPTDINKVWVCFSGYSNGNKVYYTSNGGTSWTNISGTLPNVPVNCIAYHNNGQDGIYIGTDIGVFYKDNTMTDWEPFRNGLPNVMILDLEITQNKIRAATYGRGIWQSDLRGNICVENYALSGDIAGYQSLWANTITSTATITGGIGTEVYYKAGTRITLGTGFKVVPGSRFKATIGECNSSNLAVRQYSGVYDGMMSGALGVASVMDSMTVQTNNRLKVYPNPFSRQSMIEFYIARQTPVTVSLWDLSGTRVKVLFQSQHQSPGNYQVRLDAAGIRHGGYLVRLETGDYQETKKIIITK